MTIKRNLAPGKDRIGSVLVVGGGIAGMQSALDLAEAGYLVHVVTSESSIGGKMVRLDKTFPTNECAMCLLGPKMTDCQGHPNIRLYSKATLEDLTGDSGDFKARVRLKPRYVDVDECTACGDCEEVCPVEVYDPFNEGMSTYKAINRLFPQAVPNAYMIEKRGIAPCRDTCPAGTNAQGYVALISQGKFAEALEVVYRRMPFPGICGRICHHPCEDECNRIEEDGEPVSICTLKRAAADYGWEDWVKERRQQAAESSHDGEDRGSVGVIGAGPAGLTAAYDLRQAGFSVTVYDGLEKPGGMMRSGIPRYRLPEEIVDRETEFILDEGIEFIGNTVVGQDITLSELKDRHDAVLIAVGAGKSRSLPIEGIDAEGVFLGLDLLKQVSLGEEASIEKRVVVIGGGNVAMDTARTALRVGADQVTAVCLEGRDEMPAHEWEIAEALDEGVAIDPSWGPVRIITAEGKVTGIEVQRCTRVFNDEGLFSPEFDEETRKVIDCDTVVVSIGQQADLSFIDVEDIAWRRGPSGAAVPLKEPFFACGDAVHGPSSVVEAVAAGHNVAEAIVAYFDGTEFQQENLDLTSGRRVETVSKLSTWGEPRYLSLISRDGVLVREDLQQEKLTPPDNVPIDPAPRHDQQVRDGSDRAKSFVEVNLGYSREEAIAEASRCLNCGICSECLQCVEACEKKAIHHEQTEEILELPVGSVILAPGFDLYDAALAGEYGYGRHKNVITSLDFERLLSSTGPTRGEVLRPSDGHHPERIAFIQCVGSRDLSCDAEYCSSICCMYSTKEAIIAREHDSRIEPTIFYIDMRAFGKGFDRYVESAKAQGIRYERAMVSAVKENPANGNLRLEYWQGGEIVVEEFDMVVLATGVRPPASAGELAGAAGFELDHYGFARTELFEPTETTRPGVFVAGAFQGPRDIPETVMNASAAAGTAGAFLAEVRGSMVEPKRYPPERDVSQEEMRVGVFVCHCGINIGSIVDVPAVVENARSLPGVAHAEEALYTCSQDNLKHIKEVIDEHQLNRVVVASCTIRTHQPLFREALREVGLNQFLFEMANIRDQCSWVHRNDPAMATEKAHDLVGMAVAKVKHHEPLQMQPVPVVQRALIIGGGVAGISAALATAEQGYPVYLVEREAELGGMARRLRRTVGGDDIQAFLVDSISAVDNNPLIEVMTSSEIVDFGGHAGHFKTTIRQRTGPEGRADTMRELEHGVIIVATGGKELQPEEYGFGQHQGVVTNVQFEEAMADGLIDRPEAAAFIQCVGSREGEGMYCSRTCCTHSLKNAIAVKEANPEAMVYVLYRELRSYGLKEQYYREAREKGVVFLQFPDEDKPEVSIDGDGDLHVTVFDEATGVSANINPEYLVLAAGTVPAAGSQGLATLLKVPTNDDGFFLETHIKLAPMDFPSQGIFLCGASHSPKFIDESIYQAQGAMARACTILSKDHLMVGGVVAVVDPDKCAACLTCVRVCPFSVPKINEDEVAEINAVQCHGCGNCAADCPGKAIQLQHYNDEQLVAKIAGLFEGVSD